MCYVGIGNMKHPVSFRNPPPILTIIEKKDTKMDMKEPEIKV